MNFMKHLGGIFNITSKMGEVQKTVMHALMSQLSIVEDDLDLMLLELCLSTATGKWLDEWGAWFGVYRKNNEPDRTYSTRIIATIQTPKSTIPAIKQNMANYLNSLHEESIYTSADVEVIEPFEYIKLFSHRGTFSGRHKFPDGEYYRRCVIDVKLPENPTPEMKRFLMKIKAAGIQAVYTISPIIGQVDMTFEIIEPTIEQILVSELYCEHIVEGLIHSVRSGNSRYHSGRRKLWGINKDVVIEQNMVGAFRRFSMSYFYNENNFKIPVILPGGTGQALILSQHTGKLSGVDLPKLIYETKPPEDDKLDLQCGFERGLTKYKGHRFSRLGGLSEGHPLSGIWDDHYIDTPVLLTPTMTTSNRYFVNSEDTFLQIQMMINKRTRERLMSGRQHLWKGDFIIEKELNMVTLKRELWMTPYLRLIEVAKTYYDNGSWKFNTLEDKYTDQVPDVTYTTWTDKCQGIHSGRLGMSTRNYRSGTPGYNYETFDFTLLFDNPRPEVEVKSDSFIAIESTTEHRDEKAYLCITHHTDLQPQKYPEFNVIDFQVVHYEQKIENHHNIQDTLQFIEIEPVITDSVPVYHKNEETISTELGISNDELEPVYNLHSEVLISSIKTTGTSYKVKDTESFRLTEFNAHSTTKEPRLEQGINQENNAEYNRYIETFSRVYGIPDLEPLSSTKDLEQLSMLTHSQQSAVQITLIE